jgi:RNA polymerase sigma-70 factor (ECF subfamily)
MLRLLRFPRPSDATRSSSPEAVDPLGALAQAATRGDRKAQRTLLVSVGPALLRAVRGVLGTSHPDVEDVLQEAMAAVHGALPTFRGECRVLHFACRVAVRTALHARRRAGYRERYTPLVAPDELSELAGSEDSTSDAHATRTRRETLRHLLDELPEVQAEALVLHLVLGHSVDETAAMQRVPLNTARSRLRTALASLRARVTTDPAILAQLRLEP